MNSNSESILVFSPALLVPAGQTVSVDLLASLTGTGTGNIGLSVEAATAVSATAASVTGSFPINGNLMSLIDYKVVQLAFTATGTATTVKVGDENVELGHFTLDFNTSGSATAKDVNLTSVMLKNNGVEDLSNATMNLYLEQAGEKVSSSYTTDGRYVTFNFNSNYQMKRDDGSKIFYIKGDIIAKDNSGTDSISLELNKSTDFSAYESATGFGANIYTTSNGTVLANNYLLATAEIKAGSVSVSKKSTSPSDTTVVKGSDSVVLLANIRADQNITADGLRLYYGSGNATATTSNQFENVRVYLNGVLLDSFDPEAATGTATYATIDSTLTLNAGDNEVKVMVKAKSSASASAAFQAQLDGNIFTSMNPEYSASGNSVIDISGTATGGIFSVNAAVLTTVRNDGYGSGTIVQGSTGVSLGKFVVKATYDDVKVTSISFGYNVASTTIAVSSISNMKLYVDGVQVGSTVDFGSSGASFNSLNFIIAKDATKSIELKGDFDSSASGNFLSTMTVNALDSRGATVTGGNNTASTASFATAAAGSLQVVLDGATPVAGLLATKAGVEQEVAKIKFTAINDSANLTEINLINTPLASSTIASTSVGVDAADSRIASVRLYDGTTLVDSFVPVSGAGKFTINNSIIIPASGNKTLSVRVVLNNINNDANATNKDVHFGVTTVKFKSSAGSESTQGVALLANNFRLRKTVPTVALQTLPSPLLTAGTVVASKFTVTADSNGDVTLGKIVLKYSTSTDVVIATMVNGVRIDGSTNAASSTVDTSGKTITVTFDTPQVISAGTTKTFEILTNVTATGSDSQSLSTSINDAGSYVLGAAGDAASAVTGNFVWSDGASLTQTTYINEHNVSGLPTYTQSMTK